MRIKIFLLAVSSLVLLIDESLSQVNTQVDLPNFTPGTYILKQGNAGRCGDGEFEISKDNNHFLHLGPKHIMGTKTGKQSDTQKLPDEPVCHSESSDNLRYLDKTTIITQNAEEICGGKLSYKLMRQVTIQQDNIKLEVNQQELGADNRMKPFTYSCSWELSKRNTDSIPKLRQKPGK